MARNFEITRVPHEWLLAAHDCWVAHPTPLHTSGEYPYFAHEPAEGANAAYPQRPRVFYFTIRACSNYGHVDIRGRGWIRSSMVGLKVLTLRLTTSLPSSAGPHTWLFCPHPPTAPSICSSSFISSKPHAPTAVLASGLDDINIGALVMIFCASSLFCLVSICFIRFWEEAPLLGARCGLEKVLRTFLSLWVAV